jgi:Ca2+-binding RTX toxin-like protein
MAFYKNADGILLSTSKVANTKFVGKTLIDDVVGGLGNDELRGGDNGHLLKGGAGDDTYYLFWSANGKDSVVETANAGIDTVVTKVNFTLPEFVENLEIRHLGYGAGNGLANIISGTADSQTFDGKGGSDVLIGNGGNDTYIFQTGSGRDIITDFSAGKGAGDVIRLQGYGFKSFDQVQAALSQDGADTVLRLSATDSVRLTGVTASSLDADDFHLQLDTSRLQQTFADEFNSLSLATTSGGTWKTNFYHGSQTGLSSHTLMSNGEDEIYVDAGFSGSGKAALGLNPFSTQDGILSITAQKTPEALKASLWGYEYTSGILTTETSFAQQYGYFEIRAELPTQQGMFPAFWMLPSDHTWPPEIDIFEHVNGADSIHSGAITNETGSKTGTGFYSYVGDLSVGYHTYGLSWTAEKLTWYVDGVEVGETRTPDDMHKPMYMLVNLAVGSDWSGPADKNFVSAQLHVDYIRAFQFKGEAVTTLATKSGSDGQNDTYEVRTSQDIIREAVNGGIDTARTTVSYVLPSNVENLLLLGKDRIDGAGNADNNILTGNEAVNKLEGMAGNDVLDGGAGADQLIGGLGNDTYVVDDIGDQITEVSGEGRDRVISSISYTLGSNLEDLTLSGRGAINGTGNDLANTLVGNDQSNTLNGGAGDDLLDGGAGADTLIGGKGNDVYVVAQSGDTVVELASEGSDTVQSSVNFVLGAYVESLVLTGTAISGTGNDQVNRIEGNASNNTLLGMGGNDVLIGDGGSDFLDGGVGADDMSGGLGDDTYKVDNSLDIIRENAGEGMDSVRSSISYKLGANVENLALTADAVINGTGNELANLIEGNTAANRLEGLAGDDILDGKLGADTMFGGLGNDKYYVNVQGDIVTELAGEGIDTVYSSVRYTLGANVENLVLTTDRDLNATGNELANRITGGAGANRIEGQAGDDILNGGAGQDVLVGGSGKDLFQFNLGDGKDVIADFQDGLDRIDLSAFVQAKIGWTIGAVGPDAVVSFANGDSLTLTGVDFHLLQRDASGLMLI